MNEKKNEVVGMTWNGSHSIISAHLYFLCSDKTEDCRTGIGFICACELTTHAIGPSRRRVNIGLHILEKKLNFS